MFRVGAGYFWRPAFGQLLNADILSALVTVESSLQGTEHEFRNWGTVAGAAELRILEVLMVSAGIENVIRLASRYGYWPEYPVLRYGVGLDIHLARIFEMHIPFTLQLDYAHTKWDSRDEEEEFWNLVDNSEQVNSFSIQLRAGLF